MSNDNYATPSWLMEIFEDFYDPCPLNPTGLRRIDGLHSDWKDRSYANVPYSNPLPWVEKAIEESKKGKLIVMLLRVDTSTKWFAKLIEAKAHILWFSGRLKFANDKPANFPSMLVILKNP